MVTPMSGQSSGEPEAWAKARQSLAEVVPQRGPAVPTLSVSPQTQIFYNPWTQSSPYGTQYGRNYYNFNAPPVPSNQWNNSFVSQQFCHHFPLRIEPNLELNEGNQPFTESHN
ncbi:unnamed protein product, partial [Oppiella nova]